MATIFRSEVEPKIIGNFGNLLQINYEFCVAGTSSRVTPAQATSDAATRII
jgi:hypothetical protein